MNGKFFRCCNTTMIQSLSRLSIVVSSIRSFNSLRCEAFLYVNFIDFKMDNMQLARSDHTHNSSIVDDDDEYLLYGPLKNIFSK